VPPPLSTTATSGSAAAAFKKTKFPPGLLGVAGGEGGFSCRRCEREECQVEPKECELAHAILWEYNYKRLELAQRLGQLGGFLTL
jgi:hypothetical protein